MLSALCASSRPKACNGFFSIFKFAFRKKKRELHVTRPCKHQSASDCSSNMDGAASVIAVISIAIQLQDSLKKLHDFWQSVQDAPQDIQTIVNDLALLCDILEHIRVAFDADGSQPGPVVERVLLACNENVKPLDAIVHDLQLDFGSSRRVVRKWAAVKTQWKWEKVKKLPASIDRMKSTLMLVLQSHLR